MPTNKECFLHAANWALENERNGIDVGINIRRMGYGTGPSSVPSNSITLFNTSKGLLYDGFSAPEQELLKGLIVQEDNGNAIDVLACCFKKFYNYGEPAEKNQHEQYLNRNDIHIFYKKKEDGVNIRPYWNSASGRVEFATRGTLCGLADNEETALADFGQLARDIATAKFPVLLTKEFTRRYSCVFEMIHPDTKILTDYGEQKTLILLAAFDLQEDCHELSEGRLSNLAIKNRIWMVERWYFSATTKYFDDDLLRLQKKWQDTDHEGTVAVFTDADSVAIYRLKIKNKKYLEMLRIARFCSLKNTRGMIEEHNLQTWDALRDHLYASYSEMSEELEMGYQEHFETYRKWEVDLFSFKYKIMQLFNYTLPHNAEQREFAEEALKSPYHSFFFAMRSYEKKHETLLGWDNQEKVLRLLEKFVPLKGIEDENG